MNNPNFNDIPDSLPTPDPNAMNPVMSAETADTSAATGVAGDMEALLAGPAPVNNSIATPARETPAQAVTQPAAKEKKGSSPIVAILITLILAGAAGVGGGYFLFGNQKNNTPADKPNTEQVADTTTIAEEIDAQALIDRYVENTDNESTDPIQIFADMNIKDKGFITNAVYRNMQFSSIDMPAMFDEEQRGNVLISAFYYEDFNKTYHKLFNTNENAPKPVEQWFGIDQYAYMESSETPLIYVTARMGGGSIKGFTSTLVTDSTIDGDKLAIKVGYALCTAIWNDETQEVETFTAKLADGSDFKFMPEASLDYVAAFRESLKEKASELPQYTFNFTKVDGTWKLDSVTKD